MLINTHAAFHIPHHTVWEHGFSCPSCIDPSGTNERRKKLLYNLISAFAATLPQNSSTYDTTLSLDLTLGNQ